MATQANGITNAVNTGFCQTNFNNATNTRDIIDSNRNDTQAILAKLDAMENSRRHKPRIAFFICVVVAYENFNASGFPCRFRSSEEYAPTVPKASHPQ